MKAKVESAGDMLDSPEELIGDDLEGLLAQLEEWTAAGTEEVPESLERLLVYVSRSGNTVYPWNIIQPLFRSKLRWSLGCFPDDCGDALGEEFVLQRFDSFRAAPFTIQRLAELVIAPTRHYKRKEKFLRGLEKTVTVVSTVEPLSLHNTDQNGEMDFESMQEEVHIQIQEEKDLLNTLEVVEESEVIMPLKELDQIEASIPLETPIVVDDQIPNDPLETIEVDECKETKMDVGLGLNESEEEGISSIMEPQSESEADLTDPLDISAKLIDETKEESVDEDGELMKPNEEPTELNPLSEKEETPATVIVSTALNVEIQPIVTEGTTEEIPQEDIDDKEIGPSPKKPRLSPDAEL